MRHKSELIEITDFALKAARCAGEVILPFFRSVAVEYKPDGSEVTEADRRAEALIRRELEREFPHAAILGEEFGGQAGPIPGDHWIVDPLDGTTSFALGIPVFGTLIALLRDGEPIVGVIHMPALGETVYAARGTGCHYVRDGEPPQRVCCDQVGDLSEAFISSSGVHATEVQPIDGVDGYRLAPLIERVRRFRVGGDCAQHALVCRGRLHLAIDAIMAPWDSGALVVCVREAGGTASTLSGDRENPVFGGSLVSAASDALLRDALALMARHA